MRKRRQKSRHLSITLVEVMVVTAITAIIFGAITSFLIMSNKSWQIGQDRLREQQQARMAISEISENLRRANPNWLLEGGTNYPVVISSGQIDFYAPRFYPGCCPGSCEDNLVCQDSEGAFHSPDDIASLVKTTYRLSPDNTNQLLKTEGSAAEEVVANNLTALSFSCGCAGCAAVDDSCPAVDINLTISRDADYNLQAKVGLRNQNIILSDDIPIEEPEEGES